MSLIVRTPPSLPYKGRNILSPAKLKELCEEYNLTPSKSYGQHYLISDAAIKKMVEAGELTSEDTIVEIGPGFGILTLAVAPLVKKVIAFEIEQRLKPYWEEQQKEFSNIELVWGNALNELPPLVGEKKGAYKVLANLPYQITSDAIRMLLEANPAPEKIIVMVQKEVAERMCAKPPDMSLLSVAVQYYGQPRIVTKVPAGAFWPAPKVDSAVVSIDMKALKPESMKTVDDEGFFRVVRAGFAQKRKQLWHNLSGGLQLDPRVVKAALQEVTGNDKVRAEELSVDNWQQVFKCLGAEVLR